MEEEGVAADIFCLLQNKSTLQLKIGLLAFTR